MGDSVYATLGGAWASHKGSCAVIKQTNSATPITTALDNCGSQTLLVGRVMRIGKTVTVTIRATSEDGTRTADSSSDSYYIEGDNTNCQSVPVSFSGTSNDDEYLRAFAPALPPCDECPRQPGTQCPVMPVSTPADQPANQPVDGRYTWAGLLFGGAALLRTLRLRGRGHATAADPTTEHTAYPEFPSGTAGSPRRGGTHR